MAFLKYLEESEQLPKGVKVVSREKIEGDERSPHDEPDAERIHFDINGTEYIGVFNHETGDTDWEWNGEEDPVPPQWEELSNIFINFDGGRV